MTVWELATAGGVHVLHALVVAGAAVVAVAVTVVDEARSRSADGRRPVRARRATGVLRLTALGLVGAAAVHAAVAPEHFRESVLYGAFFTVAATGQLACAALVLLRPTRGLLRLVAATNAGTILLWGLTRVSGLPFGPEPWQRERITGVDLSATACELLVVATAVLALAGWAQRHTSAPG